MTGTPRLPRYSVVVPIFDEQENLAELTRRLTLVLEELGGAWEVILVDDGSRDASLDIMRAINARDLRFKVISLSRNFGHQLAITAGLDLADGDAVIVMDGDLQDPPELIPEMVARWDEGYEVVYAIRKSRRGETWLSRARAKVFYRVLRRMTETDLPVDAGDFRLLDRRVLDALNGMRENNRYIRGMVSWLGFRQTGVEHERAARFAGKTKYPLQKLMKLATDGLLSFSNAPLRLALKFGLFVSALSFALGFGAVAAKLAGRYDVPGIASLVVIGLFLGGMQLVILGILGEYVARIYDEVKRRPLYLVSELHGFDRDYAEPIDELARRLDHA